MQVRLFDHQKKAVEDLKPGSILCGGVGSGKSITSIAYYFDKICNAQDNGRHGTVLKTPTDLYIITTARKRDTKEWQKECLRFCLSVNPQESIQGIKVVIDSWNNIVKYSGVSNAFFIFDEQRVVGYGTWTKTFLKIAKANKWILLSATPGDTWSDYIPVFIANGFYRNKSEFMVRHAVYNHFSKFPKIDRYVDTRRLEHYRDMITVNMRFQRSTTSNHIQVLTNYNRMLFNDVIKTRWNPYTNEPIRDASGVCYTLRRVVNSDPSRISALLRLLEQHDRVIVFYNFNYELQMLRQIDIEKAEWNGQKHEPIPSTDKWMYLVQYNAGAEGWNCITTDTIVFFSQNYSYKMMTQAAGRIDRLNTPYLDLYYYHLVSHSKIDVAIKRALDAKKSFNESSFVDQKFA